MLRIPDVTLRRSAPPVLLLITLIALVLAAACGGGDDNSSATPTGSSAASASGSPAPSGTAISTPAGTGGAPAVCTQEDAQKGTITTLDFGEDNKVTYDPGQEIEMTFTIANCGDNAITLTYPTTQRYEFFAQDDNLNKVWSSADNKVFDQVQGQQTVGPNETVVYTETWDQKDSSGAQVPDGRYKISAFSVGCSSGQTDCHFGPIRFVQIGEAASPSSS